MGGPTTTSGLAKLDPEPFNGHLQKRQDILFDAFGTGEARLQGSHDAAYRPRAIDALENLAGAVVELDDAFRIKQHVAALGGLELEAITTAKRRHVGQKLIVHLSTSSCLIHRQSMS